MTVSFPIPEDGVLSNETIRELQEAINALADFTGADGSGSEGPGGGGGGAVEFVDIDDQLTYPELFSTARYTVQSDDMGKCLRYARHFAGTIAHVFWNELGPGETGTFDLNIDGGNVLVTGIDIADDQATIQALIDAQVDPDGAIVVTGDATDFTLDFTQNEDWADDPVQVDVENSNVTPADSAVVQYTQGTPNDIAIFLPLALTPDPGVSFDLLNLSARDQQYFELRGEDDEDSGTQVDFWWRAGGPDEDDGNPNQGSATGPDIPPKGSVTVQFQGLSTVGDQVDDPVWYVTGHMLDAD